MASRPDDALVHDEGRDYRSQIVGNGAWQFGHHWILLLIGFHDY